jgi:divalent metal cation (Fe/Co/Zn/Cd) transporter
MGAEAAIAITAGVLAGSIALLSFGLDSVIEGCASLVIVWRFTGWRLHSQAAEERAQKLVAIQFFLLAPYVAFEAAHKLITGEQPQTSWLGIALVSSSVIGMPFLGIAKRRLADKLGSVAKGARALRTCSAPTLLQPFCSACSGMRSSAFGGSTRPRHSLSPPSPSSKDGRAWRGEGCCASC